MKMSLINKVEQFNDDVDIAHQIVHGDATTTVPTEGGPVRSLAKLIADKDAEFVGGDVVQQAVAARNGSEAARDIAVLARNAAMVGAVTYPDEATGRSAVADGEFFKVIGSGDVAAREYRRTNSTTSVLVAEYPSVGKVNGLVLVAETSDFVFSESAIRVSDGALVASGPCSATDFIKVTGGKKYNFRVGHASGGTYGSAWYDENRTFISSIPASVNVVSDVYSEAPLNARYVRLSKRNDVSPTGSLHIVDQSLSVKDLVNVLSQHNPIISAKSIAVSDGTLSEYIDENDKRLADIKDMSALVVSSKDELKTLNFGISEAAWPAGKRVYCKETRCEVTADGAFWRMPDGRAIKESDLVYSAPEWDETFNRLPDYATAHHILGPVTDQAGWVPQSPATSSNFSFDDSWGFPALHITAFAGSSTYPNIKYTQSTPVGALGRLIFKIASHDFSKIMSPIITLLDSSGNELFNRRLNYSNHRGQNPRPIYNTGIERFEVPISDFVATIEGANLADVAGIGVKLERSTAAQADIWIGDIHTANFRPMVTLRFDDQWATQYTTAFPMLEAKGFKGIMAVITGAATLANDPKCVFNIAAMSREQSDEMHAAGWNIVSHSHTHREQPSLTEDEIFWDLSTSKKYLTEELGAGLIERSVIIFPQNKVDEKTMRVARGLFDICIHRADTNSPMQRQIEGDWSRGSHWMCMGSREGDGSTGSQLIAYVQEAIEKQMWQTIMFHRIDATQPTGGLNVHPDDFQQMVDFLDANRSLVDVVTITEAVSRISGDVIT